MRKLAFLIITLALPALAQTDYHKTVVTRWAGPGEPLSYAEYIAAYPAQPLSWREVDRRITGTDEFGPVLVVVEESIYAPLLDKLNRYLDDLADAGWEPIMVSMSGGTIEDLRTILQDYWDSDGILGATLVGDLPMAWFELYEDFDNNGIPDNPWQVQFPCDLYYMDLDGYWFDGDLDGILDTHMMDWEPDIFIGQLIASPLGDEVALLSNYFDKNHAFRSGELYLPGIGLAYIDDDWAGSSSQWGGALAMATGLANIIAEIDSTTAADYLDRLDDGYYATLLCAHSSPELHQFTEQGGSVHNNVFNWQIANADVNSFFYNCFNCSGCRYSDPGYIGGWYVFGDTYGQGALGSTKTGSMLYFEDYYGAIEDGECVGEAFRQWYVLHGREPGSLMWAMSWFYGMTHIGDATLFMKVGVEIVDVQIIDDGTSGSSGDGDGIPDAGETVALNLTLQNNNPQTYEGVWVKLSCTSGLIEWLADSVYVGTLPFTGTTQADGFLIGIAEEAPDNCNLNVSAQIQDNATGLWGDTFDFIIRASDLVLLSYEMTEYQGNGDPFADPGEIFYVTLQVKNQGGDDSEAYTVYLLSVGENYVQPGTAVTGIEPLAPGAAGFTQSELALSISPDCPLSYAEPVMVCIGNMGVNDFEPRFLFQVGDQLSWSDEITDPDEALVHYQIDPAYYDQWHISSFNTYSVPYSMKFGGWETAPYWPMSDGALEIPLFKLGDGAELHFNHAMLAEDGYDGGIVEINTGYSWEILTPEGGYPGNSVSNGSYPGGPCYNGEFDWEEAVFDLSSYVPFARLRFRFGSDGGVHGEGWYVDDLSLSGDLLSGVNENSPSSVPSRFSLGQNYPNPFNAETIIPFTLPEKSRLNISIYDVSGRKVTKLFDGFKEAGNHQIHWNTDNSNLSSGTYFIRFEGKNPSKARAIKATAKLLLLK